MAHWTDWPELSWEPDKTGLSWLQARVKDLSRRVKGFEDALDDSQKAGRVPLAPLDEELGLWAGQARQVWLYLDLIERQQIPPHELSVYASELGKVYETLRGVRSALYQRLSPDAAARFAAVEGQAHVVDFAHIAEGRPTLAPEAAKLSLLGELQPTVVRVTAADEKPPTAEEVRLRLEAELTPLPHPPTLSALLESLPNAWARSVFVSLGHAAGSTSKPEYRSVIAQTLRDEDKLAALVEKMNPQTRALLAELCSGPRPYDDVVDRYGSDAADGFFWMNHAVSGALGQLRRLGLAYVGRLNRLGTVVVPSDLTPHLVALVRQ